MVLGSWGPPPASCGTDASQRSTSCHHRSQKDSSRTSDRCRLRSSARSTYRRQCPVTLDELSYITMPFWGFDHRRHTGEMIVNSSVAHDVVTAFETLYRAHFPIEEMRVTTLEEQRAAPTGDTDNTSSFECRPVTLGTSWSEHSYGLAIDINPFQNPYVRGDSWPLSWPGPTGTATGTGRG